MGCCGNSGYSVVVTGEPIYHNVPALPIYELLDHLVAGYIHQTELDEDVKVPKSILFLCRSFYGIFGNKDNVKQGSRIKKQIDDLSMELSQLQNASDPTMEARRIKDHVIINGVDPMLSPDSPYKYHPRGS